MLARIVEVRVTLALIVAAVVGTWGLHAYPMRSDDVFLALVEARKPVVFVLNLKWQNSRLNVPFNLKNQIPMRKKKILTKKKSRK